MSLEKNTFTPLPKFPPIKKSRLSNDNPTLSSLKEKALNCKANELYSMYSGFMAKKEGTSTIEVFKKTVTIIGQN